MKSDRFLTESLRDPRVLNILAAALTAVQPDTLVRHYLENTVLPHYERVFLLGIGKASEPMTLAAADCLPEFTQALIITKHSFRDPASRIEILESGHPVPDERSLAAGSAALAFVSTLHKDDLLICLISGGGSSLAAALPSGFALGDLQMLTTALLASGATIAEINLIRRRLDRLKAGGLVAATQARVISLILSDVIGDDLGLIASGMTVPGSLINTDALAILDKYKISPTPDLSSLLASESVFDESVFARVDNVIVGNNQLALVAAREQALQAGFDASLLGEKLQGEASRVGRQLGERLAMAANASARPFCLIAGGETTVTLGGSGRGGRNQELALAAVDALEGLKDVMLVSLATDGDDGPTDAGGAVVSGSTARRAAGLGISATDYLARNDSYAFFEALNDLLKPGYTGTNVNDLLLLIGL